MVLFENTFKDKDGKSFKVILPGSTVTDGENREVTPEYSLLYAGGELSGGRFNAEEHDSDGWKRYGMIHTHPSGGENKLSSGDKGKALELGILVFMVHYNSNSLYKFEPSVYNYHSDREYNKGSFMHSAEEFDESAVEKVSTEYQNFSE